MTTADSARAVHSIVFVLADPRALAGNPESAATTLQRLDHLVRQALTNSRAGAEHVTAHEFGILVSFLNSGAALTFVRVLQHLAGGAEGVPTRIGVHMGSLGTDEPQIENRPQLRLARQIAALARTGQALASPLFHNFVTQFDHRCKSMLQALPPIVDSQGRSVAVYEIRFDGMPALRMPTAAGGNVEPVADPLALPADDGRRQEFLKLVERALAEEIGPLANLVVRQAADSARSRAAFYRIIGDTLPDTVPRADFFKALDRL
jgi:hypothetical protein